MQNFCDGNNDSFFMCISIIGLVFLLDDMQICTYSKHIQKLYLFLSKYQYMYPVVLKCGINPTLLRSATDIWSFFSHTFCFISINLTLSFFKVLLYCFLSMNIKLNAQDCMLAENHEGCLYVRRWLFSELLYMWE